MFAYTKKDKQKCDQQISANDWIGSYGKCWVVSYIYNEELAPIRLRFGPNLNED